MNERRWVTRTFKPIGTVPALSGAGQSEKSPAPLIARESKSRQPALPVATDGSDERKGT